MSLWTDYSNHLLRMWQMRRPRLPLTVPGPTNGGVRGSRLSVPWRPWFPTAEMALARELGLIFMNQPGMSD